MNSSHGPTRSMVQVGSAKRAIWRPRHQHGETSRHLPKIHYLPPTAGNSNGCWKTSGQFLDFEIPKEIGVISGLNLRMEVSCDVSGGQLAPPTPYWVQQIEITVGSQILETLYPQDIFNETVGFLNKDDLDSMNEVLLANPDDYVTVNQKIPNTGIYGSNFFAYLPFNCCVTAAKLYNAGIDDPLKFRVYFPPNLWPTANGGTALNTNLSSATLVIEEEFVTPETRADFERASKEGITYATVVRQRQNQTINRNVGSSNTIDLTGINNASAGLMIYAGPPVVAGGNANNVQLTTRYEIDTIELDDNLGSKKEGLEQQRGEYLVSFVWSDQIHTSFPAHANAFTYLLPFCPEFKEAVIHGVNSGALNISTKGNDRLVLNNYTGPSNTTWSLTITNYSYQAFVVANRRLVSVIKDWGTK